MDAITAAAVCGRCAAECDPDSLYCWSCGRALDPATETRPEYAGFVRRALAYVADATVCLVGMGMVTLPVTLALGLPSVSGIPADPSKGLFFMNIFLGFAVLSKVVAWLYFTIAESSAWEGTPGKLALGIRVSDLEGNRISFGQANKRYWGKLLSGILYLGYLAMFISERKQTLHDLLAKTVVTRR